MLTRTVRDTAAISRTLPADPALPPYVPGAEADLFAPARARGPLRIGFVRDAPGHLGTLHPDVVGAVDSTVAALEELGHRVGESHPDALFDPLLLPTFFDALSVTVCQLLDQLTAEAGRPPEPDELDVVSWHWDRRGRELDGVAPPTPSPGSAATGRGRCAGGSSTTCWSAPSSRRRRPRSAGSGASRTASSGRSTSWRSPCRSNTTGQPSVAVPRGVTGDGLPVGVQLAGRFGDDELLLGLARQLEELQPWEGIAPGFR